MAGYHVPVLLEEILESLHPTAGQRVLDLTLGGGGHAEAILERIGPAGQLVGVDVDQEALEEAGARLARFAGFRALRANFAEVGELDLGDEGFDAVLMDLGVSSAQLDRAARGFSFRADAPLDMRMDQRLETTAADLVADLEERELSYLFKVYGEEKLARPIARRIVAERARQPITSTGQLAELVKAAVPARLQSGRIHPATKVFQALRIAVNRELEVLEEALEAAFARLKPGGRLAVISYHSLEDRRVKQFFLSRVGQCVCPRDFPVCVCNPRQELEIETRRPLTASEAEVERNPRARSAKLRVARRLPEAA